ncbi:hypothetical protein, partial [Phytohabitans kaempferiae]
LSGPQPGQNTSTRNNAGAVVFYPMHSNSSSLTDGSDALNAYAIGSSIRATIRVPVKNQPVIHGSKDTPTDTYAVEWDGISALIGWEQDDYDWVPISAGHVVLEVLNDAAANAGFGTYIQSCSPGCDYQLLHTTLVVEEDAEASDDDVLEQVDYGVVRLRVPSILDLRDGVQEAGFAVRIALRSFAEFKNSTRRLMNIDAHVRELSAHMLHHNYTHSRIATLKPRKRPKALWHNRGWRRETRALVAEAWLNLANMDVLSKASHDSLVGLEGNYAGLQPLLKRDYAADVAALHRLNTTPITDAIKQMTTSIDNRLLILATILGAIGGGLAGAVAAVISSS